MEKIESVIKCHPKEKKTILDDFVGEFKQTFKKLILIIFKLLQNIEEKGIPPNILGCQHSLIPNLDKKTTMKENYRLTSLMAIDAKILSTILANNSIEY